MFPPLNFAAGVQLPRPSFTGAFSQRGQHDRSDTLMRDMFVHQGNETFGPAKKNPRRVLASSKPYITAVVIATALLAVWAGLAAA